MARPIKEIPILTGENSIFFNKSLLLQSAKKASTEEKRRILSIVKAVLNKGINNAL